ncbi:MAG: nucleotide exchange factor GrpE [Chloroflexaceae bacterium]|nr:nucleotide exchange factor GrpE [Chloroflexaceae bacterium]
MTIDQRQHQDDAGQQSIADVHDQETIPPDAEQPEAGSSLEQRLAQAQAEAAEYKDQWLRAMADLKNFKRRTDAERAELVRTASANVLLKLLPLIDDVERAVASVPPQVAQTPWWDGMQLIVQKFSSILDSEGVTSIEAVGQPFDPNLHDAVMYEQAEGQDGMVTAELQKGYRLRERVLRPATVKVGKG